MQPLVTVLAEHPVVSSTLLGLGYAFGYPSAMIAKTVLAEVRVEL